MTSRRQFLTAGAFSAIAAALRPGGASSAVAAATPSVAEDQPFHPDMKRYTTMAAAAQSVAAPE
jgi:nitrous oxide reductase